MIKFPRVLSAEQAIALIRPGRRMLIGSGAAEPAALVSALVEHGQHLADNEIVHLLTLGPAPYIEPQYADRFRHTAFFIGPNVREAVQEGRADFIPVFLSEIPELIRNRRIRIDVALIQVSPPDSHGFVSLGVSVDVVRAAVECADLVLAEVNPQMPRTLGDSFVHVSRLAAMVPVDHPLLERVPAAAGEIETEIGRLVATLIADGSTLQTGIGGIPNAVLDSLIKKRDLGVHTEMLSDGIMRLADAGVVTGARKTLLRGKMVTSFVMGTQALYRWADGHPALEMRASDFTNDPSTIARNEQMISINSALAVDLTGQVASDTLLGKLFSGIGGQVDFVRGAARSRGGKAIIALPSTAREGTVSRIQAVFEEGAGVVTSRGDVRYVVTEYGIADLWGKNIRERTMSLIEIAHPQFRTELLTGAKRRHYVFPDQVVPRAVVPSIESRHETLASGTRLLVRPLRMSDEAPVQRLFYDLSQASVYTRFFAHKRIHPHDQMQQMVDLDYDQSMGLVVCEPEREEIVALGRYDVDPASQLAEFALVVSDEWQHRGLGTILLRRLAEAARARGLRGMKADVLQSNKAMMVLLQNSGLELRSRAVSGVYHIEAYFDAADIPAIVPVTS